MAIDSYNILPEVNSTSKLCHATWCSFSTEYITNWMFHTSFLTHLLFIAKFLEAYLMRSRNISKPYRRTLDLIRGNKHLLSNNLQNL